MCIYIPRDVPGNFLHRHDLNTALFVLAHPVYETLANNHIELGHGYVLAKQMLKHFVD